MSKYQVTINSKTYSVEVGDVSGETVQVVVDGVAKSVTLRAAAPAVVAAPAAAAQPVPAPVAAPAPEPEPVAEAAPVGSAQGEVVVAPMPGKVLSITVSVGASVKEGDTVCTLEAMKMEMPIACTASGTVNAIHISVGDNVSHDAPLVTVG